MDAPIVGGLLAFLGGAAVSALNYWINRRALEKKPSALASLSVVRQLLSVGYLAAVFFLSRALSVEVTWPLVGAALGLTVPAVLLSFRLAKRNDSLSAGTGSSEEEGGDSDE